MQVLKAHKAHMEMQENLDLEVKREKMVIQDQLDLRVQEVNLDH